MGENGKWTDDLLTFAGFVVNEIRPNCQNSFEHCPRVQAVVANNNLRDPFDFTADNFSKRYRISWAVDIFSADWRRYFILFGPNFFKQFKMFGRAGDQATVTNALFPATNVVSKIGHLCPIFAIFFGCAGEGKIFIVALKKFPYPLVQMPSRYREIDSVIGDMLTVTGFFETLIFAFKFLAKITAILETEGLRGQLIAHGRSIIPQNQKGTNKDNNSPANFPLRGLRENRND